MTESWTDVSLIDYLTEHPDHLDNGWTMRNDTIVQSPDETTWLIEHESWSPAGTFSIVDVLNPDDPDPVTELVVQMQITDASMIGLALVTAEIAHEAKARYA